MKNQENRPAVITELRQALLIAVIAVTAEAVTERKKIFDAYSAKGPEDKVVEEAMAFDCFNIGECAVVENDQVFPGYQSGAAFISYDGSRPVIGAKIGKQALSVSATRPATPEEIKKAVEALSDARVCSLLRNIAKDIRGTFPNSTTGGY